MNEHNIISKPWGYEYIAYQNDCVALKVLYINQGERTSLHCHPNKGTGLVVVQGQALITFIADQTTLTAPAKKMIRRGLFHQTYAINDVIMLEIETPVDKDDLVRLHDTYGRQNSGYEKSELPKKSDCLTIIVPEIGTNKYNLGISQLEVGYVTSSDNFDNFNDNDIIMFLCGGLVKTIDGRQHLVTQPGDVGEIRVVKQVSKEMDGFADDTIIMYIK